MRISFTLSTVLLSTVFSLAARADDTVKCGLIVKTPTSTKTDRSFSYNFLSESRNVETASVKLDAVYTGKDFDEGGPAVGNVKLMELSSAGSRYTYTARIEVKPAEISFKDNVSHLGVDEHGNVKTETILTMTVRDTWLQTETSSEQALQKSWFNTLMLSGTPNRISATRFKRKVTILGCWVNSTK